MDHAQFIEKHVRQELIKQGFSPAIAQGGANEAVDHYRRCSQASKKGAMFDDCLYRGKIWAEKYGMASEKPAKKGRTKKAGSLALF